MENFKRFLAYAVMALSSMIAMIKFLLSELHDLWFFIHNLSW